MTNCADGENPAGALMMTAPDVLYGANPSGDLIVDTGGNFYGTTYSGGANGEGAIFETSPNGHGWSTHAIYSFCGASNCPDGAKPSTGLTYVGAAQGQPWDQFSPLFGTASLGGAHGKGTVFKLFSDGSLWFLETIHDFKTASSPQPLLADGSGNLFVTARTGGAGRLYGATAASGPGGGGVVFRATAAGAGSPYHVLYKFCAETNCTDGHAPTGVVLDASGNVFGTTELGGPTTRGAFSSSTQGTAGAARRCTISAKRRDTPTASSRRYL